MVILAALLMVLLMALLAFAMAVGKLYVTRTELQRTADAAALAAAWQLIDSWPLTGGPDTLETHARAFQGAQQVANGNVVLQQSPQLLSEDVLCGYVTDPTSASFLLDTSGINPANTVQVSVRRTATSNGKVPLTFARLFHWDSAPMTAQATASFVVNFTGFTIPPDGSNLGILLVALDWQTWTDFVQNGTRSDNRKWASLHQRMVPGIDGTGETNLYPQEQARQGIVAR